jgi:hypothetical protein
MSDHRDIVALFALRNIKPDRDVGTYRATTKPPTHCM